ncbi:GTP cyclohydrolase 1 [Actinomycetota bacterium]|nr:GTP cyclohydrolase 1 [Actinomycetota bacterium]
MMKSSGGSIDFDGVKKAVYDFLVAIGEDPEREGLIDTPDRIARSSAEIFEGMHQDPAQILSARFKIEHSEIVIVKDIEVYSLCEHHLLPFFGVAHVCYIPDGKEVTGLSKLGRLVDCYSKRLQVQERLTSQIADTIAQELSAKGVMVILECEHLCMSMRGVEKSTAKTTTSAVRGIMKNSATRAEAMALIKG